MDNKKQQQKVNNGKACQSSDSSSRKTELQLGKTWPRNPRHRDQSTTRRNDPPVRNPKQTTPAKARLNVDKRPRPRGGGSGFDDVYYESTCESDDVSIASSGLALGDPKYGTFGAVPKNLTNNCELNSIYTPGSKKQNLNHLLNFHYTPRGSDYSTGFSVFGRTGGKAVTYAHRGAIAKKQTYNKEQYLQANFQFVVKSSAKSKLGASPDTLIKWDLIEQINIRTTEEPQCPICLYPPIAAKLTRCGHAYCWPCILHYLALSDKTWRKCPICYEAIHTLDLKSTTIVQQHEICVGEQITFHLMRRKKGSMFVEKFHSLSASNAEHYPFMSGEDDAKLFSKFIIAKRADILNIIERERRELTMDADAGCPEFVFIQQAVDLLTTRRDTLGEIEKKEGDQIEEKGLDSISDAVIIDDTDKNQEPDIYDTDAVVAAGDMVTSSSTTDSNTTAKYYYFYQSEDGQNVYLHPLNVKMLQVCYGTLDRAPLVITARILQKEYLSMDESHRRKFTCLGHLPLTCNFAVIEVDLQPPMITADILQLFQADIDFRKKERQRRERDELKRERKINEMNDRQMGKMIASTANLNLSSAHEFPTCGFQEYLPNADHNSPTRKATTAAAIPTPNRHVTYSAVTGVGDSPKLEWPTLASPQSTSININYYHELSTRAPPNVTAAASTLSCLVSSEENIESEPKSNSMTTNLGDVLAEAMFQKKQNASKVDGAAAAGKKKNKKAKKMLPIFSTGMNYNGN